MRRREGQDLVDLVRKRVFQQQQEQGEEEEEEVPRGKADPKVRHRGLPPAPLVLYWQTLGPCELVVGLTSPQGIKEAVVRDLWNIGLSKLSVKLSEEE